MPHAALYVSSPLPNRPHSTPILFPSVPFFTITLSLNLGPSSHPATFPFPSLPFPHPVTCPAPVVSFLRGTPSLSPPFFLCWHVLDLLQRGKNAPPPSPVRVHHWLIHKESTPSLQPRLHVVGECLNKLNPIGCSWIGKVGFICQDSVNLVVLWRPQLCLYGLQVRIGIWKVQIAEKKKTLGKYVSKYEGRKCRRVGEINDFRKRKRGLVDLIATIWCMTNKRMKKEIPFLSSSAPPPSTPLVRAGLGSLNGSHVTIVIPGRGWRRPRRRTLSDFMQRFEECETWDWAWWRKERWEWRWHAMFWCVCVGGWGGNRGWPDKRMVRYVHLPAIPIYTSWISYRRCWDTWEKNYIY